LIVRDPKWLGSARRRKPDTHQCRPSYTSSHIRLRVALCLWNSLDESSTLYARASVTPMARSHCQQPVLSGPALSPIADILGHMNSGRHLSTFAPAPAQPGPKLRSGSVKRVAAAVGEGAQVVATLHRVLAATERGPTVVLSR
jgi:hypothetical protein